MPKPDRHYYVMHSDERDERFFKFDEPRAKANYSLKGSVFASGLDDAFIQEQEPLGRRSLSVGDILIEAPVLEYGGFTKSTMKYYAVQPIGFAELVNDSETHVYKLKE